MLQSCKDVVSFGTVDEGTVAMLLERRGKGADGKRLTAREGGQDSQGVRFIRKEARGARRVVRVLPFSPQGRVCGGGNPRRRSARWGKNPEISELFQKWHELGVYDGKTMKKEQAILGHPQPRQGQREEQEGQGREGWPGPRGNAQAPLLIHHTLRA